MDNRAVTAPHYENFPVASWLCPPPLRPAVRAIYAFARTADDIADEGSASAAQRQQQLAEYEACLDAAARGRIGAAWPEVFEPLARAIAQHAVPLPLLHDLLSAFGQDTDNPIYPDRAALLDYCARSANPIGRLLLHLVGQTDRDALAESDAICTALQLINFWQDLSIDLARGRHYVPTADLQRCGLAREALAERRDNDATRALVRGLVAWARATMQQGAPLALRLPGRFGWELRFVVQGGLRILEMIEAQDCNVLTHRPTIAAGDAPRLAWRALRMRAALPGPATASAGGHVR